MILRELYNIILASLIIWIGNFSDGPNQVFTKMAKKKKDKKSNT